MAKHYVDTLFCSWYVWGTVVTPSQRFWQLFTCSLKSGWPYVSLCQARSCVTMPFSRKSSHICLGHVVNLVAQHILVSYFQDAYQQASRHFRRLYTWCAHVVSYLTWDTCIHITHTAVVAVVASDHHKHWWFRKQIKKSHIKQNKSQMSTFIVKQPQTWQWLSPP